MFNDLGTQQRIVGLRNELRAQKQASALSWGQLALPESTPTQTWTGDIDLTQDIPAWWMSGALVAKFVAKFTRTDGNTGAPMVNFGVSYSTSPTGIEIERSHGATIAITSEEDILQSSDCITTAVLSKDDQSVSLAIRFPTNSYNGLSALYNIVYGISSVKLTLSVAAYSPVKGVLTLEKVAVDA